MPRSEFHRELAVSSPTGTAWKALTDVPRLTSWVGIIENAVEIVPLARYEAVLMDRLGPFKLRAHLDIVVWDAVEGQFLRLRAEGEDRQVGSRLVVEASLAIGPREPGGSTVTIEGAYEVSGKVASMGSGTINKKAQKIIDEFFAAAGAELGEA